MANKTKKDIIGYRISKIHSLKFSFKEIEAERIDQIFSKQNALSLNTNTSINIDKEKSSITIDINTFLVDQAKNEVLVEHSGRTVYVLKGLEDIYNKENNNFDFPDGLLIQLFSIAYSHARALLATETSPTIYKDKYVLPVIDPTAFLKDKKSKTK